MGDEEKLKEKEIVYGIPVERDELPKPTKRLPQYDDCLKAFVSSGADLWKVNIDVLPSKDIRVVLSALKWRINNREEFHGIQIFMRRNNVYLKTKEK
jgi:hypothetical protein